MHPPPPSSAPSGSSPLHVPIARTCLHHPDGSITTTKGIRNQPMRHHETRHTEHSIPTSPVTLVSALLRVQEGHQKRGINRGASKGGHHSTHFTRLRLNPRRYLPDPCRIMPGAASALHNPTLLRPWASKPASQQASKFVMDLSRVDAVPRVRGQAPLSHDVVRAHRHGLMGDAREGPRTHDTHTHTLLREQTISQRLRADFFDNLDSKSMSIFPKVS